ncbi:unnamed protein product [Trifolium pratense]|uniref:Uncharacterized protein n=1 Tax=Trifolium pratense TaxID=57577 RepID=A0ACB0JBR2_TRIPR|nr:unnamed protein product [Trifolium pratense]
MKCSIDASFSENKVVIDMCIQDDYGAFILTKTEWFSPKCTVRVDEALDFLSALWVQRDKADIWQACGIYDLIQLSRTGLKYQQEMIIAALHFFESSTNTFHFECGMMTPTLLDVAAITGLSPLGDTYDPCKASDTIKFDFRNKSYSKYIVENRKTSDEVSDEEHVAFLTLWLSQYVFCTQSLQVAKKFIPMAIQLHECQQFNFARLVLGCLYESMRDACEHLKRTGDGSTFLGAGPFWLLQLWLTATFHAELDLFLPEPYYEESRTRQIEGTRLARMVPRERGLGYDVAFQQYFNAFLSLKKFKPSFAPFVDRPLGPPWFTHRFPSPPEFEMPSYELTPFDFAPSHACTREFFTWWSRHYEGRLVDKTALLAAISNGFDSSILNKIKSKLNARGSKSKAGSSNSSKPLPPPPKVELKDIPVLSTIPEQTNIATTQDFSPNVEPITDEKKKKKKKKKEHQPNQEGTPERKSSEIEAQPDTLASPEDPPLEQSEKKKKKKKKQKKSPAAATVPTSQMLDRDVVASSYSILILCFAQNFFFKSKEDLSRFYI